MPESEFSEDLSKKKIELEELLRGDIFNVYLRMEYAVTLQKLGKTQMADVNAGYVLRDMKNALLGELRTGELDKKFGIEGFETLEEGTRGRLFGYSRETENIFGYHQNLSSLRRTKYERASWEDVKVILIALQEQTSDQSKLDIEPLRAASDIISGIASHQDAKVRNYLTLESIAFLVQCIGTDPPLSPYDIGEALEFYVQTKDLLGNVESRTEQNLVTFFSTIKRYDVEFAMLTRFCSDGRVRHVVDTFNPNNYPYVLGVERSADLVARLEAVDETDGASRRVVYNQMVSRILEQNALKCQLGIVNYTNFIREILTGKDKKGASFFKGLCPDFISEEQLKSVENFIAGFNVDRIPIHEYVNPTTTRNSDFEARIQLGNSGELVTFVKLYTSPDRINNAKRERFFLEGRGKTILLKYDVQVPPALGFAEAKLRDGKRVDALLMYFINARTLDQVVKDPSLPEYNVIDKLLKNATIELAKVHNATAELEAAATVEDVRLFDVGPEYFEKDLQIQLFMQHSNLQKEVAKNLLASSIGICNYLKEESVKDGCYYKDSNTRNIFGPSTVEYDVSGSISTRVTLLDYECGVKILGEVDLMKIMRNGKGFEEWDPQKDYAVDSELEFNNTLRRIYILIGEYGDLLLKAAKTLDKEALQSMRERHFNIAKFIFYCQRLINTRSAPQHHNPTVIHYIVAELDEILDIMKYTAADIVNYKGKKLNSETIQLMGKIIQQNKNFSEYFYKPDNNHLMSLVDNRWHVRKQLKKSIDKLPKFDTYILTNMTYILESYYHLSEARMCLDCKN
jgi:hypothetical protein